MAAFEAERAAFEARQVGLLAASTDAESDARGTVDTLGLGFAVGYGLPLVETAERFGAFYEERRGILHATGFVLRPGGVIAAAQYSAGPIGRLVPDDVLRLIDFYRRDAG